MQKMRARKRAKEAIMNRVVFSNNASRRGFSPAEVARDTRLEVCRSRERVSAIAHFPGDSRTLVQTPSRYNNYSVSSRSHTNRQSSRRSPTADREYGKIARRNLYKRPAASRETRVLSR